MLLAPVGSEPSSLHSTTAHGRPLTKSTMSGMMNGLTRPGVSTRNWLIAMKRLRSGCAQSTSRTSGYSSPVRSLRPTTTRVWPISFLVTIWLASISGLPATSTVSSSCRLASCASVSQGEPSGRRLMPRTVSQKTRRKVTSRKSSRRLAAGSLGMACAPWSMTSQPSAARWLRKGFST